MLLYNTDIFTHQEYLNLHRQLWRFWHNRFYVVVKSCFFSFSLWFFFAVSSYVVIMVSSFCFGFSMLFLMLLSMLYSSIHLLVIITFASVHPSYAAYLRLSLIGYNCCVESWSIDLSKPVYTGLSLALRHLYFSSSYDPGELII